MANFSWLYAFRWFSIGFFSSDDTSRDESRWYASAMRVRPRWDRFCRSSRPCPAECTQESGEMKGGDARFRWLQEEARPRDYVDAGTIGVFRRVGKINRIPKKLLEQLLAEATRMATVGITPVTESKNRRAFSSPLPTNAIGFLRYFCNANHILIQQWIARIWRKVYFLLDANEPYKVNSLRDFYVTVAWTGLVLVTFRMQWRVWFNWLLLCVDEDEGFE